MGFSLEISVPVLTVFFQGLLSFFSPCVLPLIPIYIGYLSGGTGQIGEDGRIHFKRSKVLFHTVFFVLGVSFAFFSSGIGIFSHGKFSQRKSNLVCQNRRRDCNSFWVISDGISGKKLFPWERETAAF